MPVTLEELRRENFHIVDWPILNPDYYLAEEPTTEHTKAFRERERWRLLGWKRSLYRIHCQYCKYFHVEKWGSYEYGPDYDVYCNHPLEAVNETLFDCADNALFHCWGFRKKPGLVFEIENNKVKLLIGWY